MFEDLLSFFPDAPKPDFRNVIPATWRALDDYPYRVVVGSFVDARCKYGQRLREYIDAESVRRGLELQGIRLLEWDFEARVAAEAQREIVAKTSDLTTFDRRIADITAALAFGGKNFAESMRDERRRAFAAELCGQQQRINDREGARLRCELTPRVVAHHATELLALLKNSVPTNGTSFRTIPPSVAGGLRRGISSLLRDVVAFKAELTETQRAGANLIFDAIGDSTAEHKIALGLSATPVPGYIELSLGQIGERPENMGWLRSGLSLIAGASKTPDAPPSTETAPSAPTPESLREASDLERLALAKSIHAVLRQHGERFRNAVEAWAANPEARPLLINPNKAQLYHAVVPDITADERLVLCAALHDRFAMQMGVATIAPWRDGPPNIGNADVSTWRNEGDALSGPELRSGFTELMRWDRATELLDKLSPDDAGLRDAVELAISELPKTRTAQSEAKRVRRPRKQRLTDRQKEVMSVYVECGNNATKAANILGMKRQAVQNVVKAVKSKLPRNVSNRKSRASKSLPTGGRGEIMLPVDLDSDCPPPQPVNATSPVFVRAPVRNEMRLYAQ